MRTFHFRRAIGALAAAGALAVSPVLTNYAAAQRPLADVSLEEWQALSDACSNEKAAALAVLFPNGATAQQQEDFDHAFAQQLTGAASTQLMPQWQAFSEQSAAGAPHAAENAFAACVYHARIRQLDPNAAFPTPAQSQTDQLFANLPRRDGGAGANMIAQSLDPAARAERQRLQQHADAERQARQQQAAANNAAFWDTLLGVVATVGNAYVDYESQRAQIEAGDQAAAAQAAANALAAQQQQQAAAPPPSQGGYAYTTVDGRCIGTACPAGNADQGGGHQTPLDPTTGRPCVTMTGQERAIAGSEYFYHMHFQNTCSRSFSYSAHIIPRAGTPTRPIRGTGIGPAQNGRPATSEVVCAENNGVDSCAGFSDWWLDNYR
jgi:hypothetical protein